MKKAIGLLAAVTALALALGGCGTGNAGDFDGSKPISVISRESGSGTRGAFVELFGVEEKDAGGQKVDYTTVEASVTNSTSVMMTTVSGDKYAIGYVSLGSLNDTVKALEIDGAAATVDNIKSGAYTIARPFNIALAPGASPAAQDFMAFIMSDEGQAIVEANGYVSIGSTGPFSGASPTGKIVVAGSSSITPVMEKLLEAYNALNPALTIELQQSDSSTGMNSAIDGVCDIGMASRELKDSEIQAGLTSTVIAMDGIAVIVNNQNTTVGLTADQVKAIFVGQTLTWLDIA